MSYVTRAEMNQLLDILKQNKDNHEQWCREAAEAIIKQREDFSKMQTELLEAFKQRDTALMETQRALVELQKAYAEVVMMVGGDK